MKTSLTKIPAKATLSLLSYCMLATVANAAITLPGKIGNYVWNDLNQNGIQDLEEPGIPGVTVTLTKPGGVIVTATTDATGYYLFTGLWTEAYQVTVTTPSGLIPSPTIVGADRAADSNVSGSTVTLTTTQLTDYTIDFGFFAPTGAIGNFVWQDLDQNGIQDSGEPGIDGVTVQLTDAADPATVLATTVTENNGAYLFPALAAGTYKVVVDTSSPALAGFVPTFTNDPSSIAENDSDASPLTVVLPADNSEDLNADFGFIPTPPGTIGDFVWFDRNNNGIQDAPGAPNFEPGISGVTVQLINLDQPQAPAVTTVTDPDGYYLFQGLLPGNYRVVVDDSQPALADAGYLPVTPLSQLPEATVANDSNVNPSDVTLTLLPAAPGGVSTTSSDTTVDFGFYRLSSLAGFTYLDLNNDGVIQATEVAIPGVTVMLTGYDFNGAEVNLMTTTDTNGYYLFADLQPSDAAGYMITEIQPSGYLDGKDTIGTPGGNTTDDAFRAVVLGYGVDGENNNFGELPEEEQGPSIAFLTGFVYWDANNDGIKDLSELPISGATVTVTGTDINGTPVNATATTDATGLYSFLLVPSNVAGYTIRETQPSGYLDGKDTIGTPGGTTANDVFSNVGLNSGVNGVDNNFGERVATCPVSCGDTATIGYWQNCNGQALIKAVNGGCNSTAFANWLATSYPYLYGVHAGANNLTGKNNKAVAAKFIAFFKVKGTKTDAQVMAGAIAAYVTNSTLAGGNYAARYGFKVSTKGTGAKTYNVGSCGTSIGLLNNTSYTVSQLLQQANLMKQLGTFNAGSFNTIFDGINRKGDIK